MRRIVSLVTGTLEVIAVVGFVLSTLVMAFGGGQAGGFLGFIGGIIVGLVVNSILFGLIFIQIENNANLKAIRAALEKPKTDHL